MDVGRTSADVTGLNVSQKDKMSDQEGPTYVMHKGVMSMTDID